ncbi:phospho-N-acetylmuramoyl-pentapeptide-transferase [Chlamydia sp.]|uniref:phospho-N-acetylmuramoyl-pentapeptide- transferase n=1 Tax=Chlamydia sp. TaxID=35827 RepID=UPI0025C6CE3B|nr:phospho-N-acetylmuramoyl-pentapeptide-transferase [Chlamydia sp.]MBQ8498596.1 phospho-N-acetylmuramoyl-pentapeptide-transferase [Chlamydia sp.]
MFSLLYALKAFFIGLLFSLVLTKPLIFWLKKRGVQDQIHKDYCETLVLLHKDKARIPTAGGLVFVCAVILVFLVLLPWDLWLTWFFVGVALLWGWLGWHDDQIKNQRKTGHGLSAKRKFLIQNGLAVGAVIPIMAAYKESFLLMQLPFIGGISLPNCWLSYLFCFTIATLAIVGTSNSVNLTDGLDGLAAGAMVMACLGMLVVTFASSAPWTLVCGVLLAALAGSCLGFLYYNRSPARIFMGDTGSLFLGGMLGISAVLLRAEFMLLFMGGIFVLESLSVIIQVGSCKLRKKRVFLCSPLHHHYEYKGMSEKAVVRNFWFVEFVCVVIGIVAVFWN